MRCCSLTTISRSNRYKLPPAGPHRTQERFLHSFLSWIAPSSKTYSIVEKS
jgi:hypothetical protein